MARIARVDERGRIVLPHDVREALGLVRGSRVLLRLRSDGVVELIPLERLYRRVTEVFREKLRDWREEDHEASRLIEELVRGSGDS